MKSLDLSDLQSGIPALTGPMAGVLEEASVYCLHDQGHKPGAILKVDGSYEQDFELSWSLSIDENMLRCYGDKDEATEWGACGIAILLILQLTEYTAVDRSRKGTGFDYWLGSQDDVGQNFFEHKARLEISGIRCGSNQDINHRVKIKLKQSDPTDKSELPAYAAVVEFSRPQSRIAKK